MITECRFLAGFLVLKAGLLESWARLLNVSVEGMAAAAADAVEGRRESGGGCWVWSGPRGLGAAYCCVCGSSFFLLEMDLKLARTVCLRDLGAGAGAPAAGSALCLARWCREDMLHSCPGAGVRLVLGYCLVLLVPVPGSVCTGPQQVAARAGRGPAEQGTAEHRPRSVPCW